MKKEKVPNYTFLRFWIPIIEVLKELGGSGKVAEVSNLVIEKLNISKEEQAVSLKNSYSKVKNQIAWARMYLVKSGFLDSPQRGTWRLTQKGLKSNLTFEDVQKTFKEVHKDFLKKN